MPRRARLAFVGACALLLSSCHVPGFALQQAADSQGEEAARLWRGTELTALAVGVLVWGLIFYAVIRYRRRKNTPEDAIPDQRAYIVPLEVFYTIVPLVIVGILFAYTTSTQRRMNAVSSHPDIRIDAVAFQWGWQFHYDSGDVTVTSLGSAPPVLVLPLHKVVQVRLTATDVVHAFYVPAFLFQRNAVPGSPTTFDLTPTRTGDFHGQCSTFCGIRHYQMTFTVRIVTPQQFDQWLATAGAAP